MTTLQSKVRPFHTLDGIRGIAAILVVGRHIGKLGISRPESYLAVDMFFLLSGFVIAYSYEHKIKSKAFFWAFLKTRLIRLYPLYILGFTIGLIGLLIYAPTLSASDLILTTVVSVLMLPQLPGVPISCSNLNAPVWTLPLELYINLVYAYAVKSLTNRVLLLIIAASAVTLSFCRWHYETLDGGWSIDQIPLAVSRLCFSFFAGVLTFRLFGNDRREGNLTAWACVIIVGFALSLKVPSAYSGIYEVALVVGLFPAVLFVACRNEPARISGTIFRFLGLVSYAVYVLHAPVGALVDHVFAEQIDHMSVFSKAFGFSAFLASIITLAWLADVYFDNPLRLSLKERFLNVAAAR